MWIQLSFKMIYYVNCEDINSFRISSPETEMNTYCLHQDMTACDLFMHILIKCLVIFFPMLTGYYLRCCKTVWNSNVLQCVSLAIVIVLLTNLIQRKDKVIFTTNKLWHSRYHFEFMQSGFYRFWFVVFFLSVKQAKNNATIIQIFKL